MCTTGRAVPPLVGARSFIQLDHPYKCRNSVVVEHALKELLLFRRRTGVPLSWWLLPSVIHHCYPSLRSTAVTFSPYASSGSLHDQPSQT